VLVVGAGMFGTTAALELRRRGYRVTLVDPGALPRAEAASTDISKIVRLDYGADELLTSMAEASLECWRTWNVALGEQVFFETGFLVAAERALEPGSFEGDSYELLQRRGHPLERLDAATVSERFPAWQPGPSFDGYYNPQGGWAASGRVMELLLAYAREAGITVADGFCVDVLVERGGKIVGVATGDGYEVRSDLLVLAAGAWTPGLLPAAAELMQSTAQPVVYFQVPAAPALQALPCWAGDISRSGWYGFPATSAGIFKVGHHGPGLALSPECRPAVEESHIESCREFLARTIPAAAQAPVASTRLCFYCDSWDGDFYVDYVPEMDNVIIVAGDSGHGFKFAPVFGELVADVVEGRDNPWAGRFRWRPRGKPTKEAARLTDRVDS
jgi:glycine/D-amino acid oxidase-like deaminating enzyme